MRKLIAYFIAAFLSFGLLNVVIAEAELLPDLAVTSIDAPASASIQEQFEVSWTVKNQGNGDAIGSWHDPIYLSTNDKLDDADTYLTSSWHFETLLAAESYTVTKTLIIPRVPVGIYYLIAGADKRYYRWYENIIYESNEENNVLAKQITIKVPDLVITNISAPASANTQEQIEVSWTVTNQDEGQTTNAWVDMLYFSKDDQVDESDIPLTLKVNPKPLVAGNSYTMTQAFIMPGVTAGTYYLLARADLWSQIYESNEENNVLAKQITIKVPDLAVTSIDAPTSASTQERIEISWTVKNQGEGKAQQGEYGQFWYDALFLSEDDQLDESDIPITSQQNAKSLVAGENYTTTQTAIMPNVSPGTYYLLAKTDAWSYIYESNEENNVLSKQITIKVPDLLVVSMDAPTYVSTQEQVNVSWIVTNQGEGDAPTAREWWDADKLYLSKDTIWDSSDILLDYFGYWRPALASGASYTAQLNVKIPEADVGNYYLLVRIDPENQVSETNEDNNLLAKQITIKVPDLVVTNISAPVSASTQERIEFSWTVKNQGDGKTITGWYDGIYLSKDDQFDVSDIFINNQPNSKSLVGGESYTIITQTLPVPSVPAGSYFLLIKADIRNYLYESNEENNVLAKPITIGVPDLVVSSLQVPSQVSTSEWLSVSWTVTNQGDGQAISYAPWYWFDGLYLSKDELFDNSDMVITSGQYSKPVLAGESYTITATAGLPRVPSGNYYLLIKTDERGYLYESNKENNLIAKQITIVNPDLVVTYIDAPVSASTQEQINVSWIVTNQGAGKAEIGQYERGWYTAIYLSTDNQLDDADPFLTFDKRNEPLAPGESYTVTRAIGIPGEPAGNYYFLVMADSWPLLNNIYESNEENNLFAQPITIQVPDLIVTSIDAPASASTQEQISVSWTVTNQGEGKAEQGQYEGGWYTAIYLSTDNQLDGSDSFLTFDKRNESLLSAKSYTVTRDIIMPVTPPGNYYLLVMADSWPLLNNIYESNKENNLLAQLITIQVPDLIVTSIDAPAFASTQEQIQVSWSVKNQGNGSAAPAVPYWDRALRWDMWMDYAYFSTDSKLDNSDTWLVGSLRLESLPSNETYTTIKTVTIPNVPLGTHYLIVKTDISNRLYESEENNNLFVQPINIQLPDLVITSIDAPSSVNPQQEIDISWTVKNQGGGAQGTAQGADTDKLYISTDEDLDNSDILLNPSGYWRPALAGGASDIAKLKVQIPNLPVGNYYLLVQIDPLNRVSETKEWNNVLSKLITIVEKDEEADLSEKYSDEFTLVEDLFNQKATLTDIIVTGDLTGSLNFTELEIVSINSGSFKGKGFSKGEWTATLEGVTYQGHWQGVFFPVTSERKIYLKGTISGGEARGIVDGYLTESIPESGIYDQCQATWRLSYLGGSTVSVTLNLEGKLSYGNSYSYPSTELRILQTAVEGTTLGHYTENISTVFTHLSITSEDNPYFGEGFSIISYTTKLGSGAGWTYDRVVEPGKTELNGIFISPLLGILSGALDETTSPKTLSLSIERIDLGLPPAPDLKVKVWGPERVSPGQKIDYIIEYRNDGVKAADKVFVSCVLDTLVKYISASEGVYYSPYAHRLSWKIGSLPAKTNGYLSFQVEVIWGLPQGFPLEQNAYITNIGD